jgi:hypothetical protein
MVKILEDNSVYKLLIGEYDIPKKEFLSVSLSGFFSDI